MRASIAVAVIALCRVARADEPCDGPAAPSPECNALPHHKGRMSMAIGWETVDLDPAGRQLEIRQAGYVNNLGNLDGSTVGPLHGNGFYMDVRLHFLSSFYAGVEMGLAWASLDNATTPYLRPGDGFAWNSPAMLLRMTSVVGARIPLGRLSVRGELVSGIHGAALSGTMTASTLHVAADYAAPLVEPRTALDLWASRWYVVEAFAGFNLIDRAERVVGLGLSFHSQAFDGAY